MTERVKWVRLGDYIEKSEEVNSEQQFGIDDVRGVSNMKGFIKTKADVTGRNLLRFQLVKPQYFSFNRRTTRNGERLGLGYNSTSQTYICTEDYVVFKSKDPGLLLAGYLYVCFLRDEFDRRIRYDSWGSATEFFNWEDMQRIMIPLPSIEVQRELVDTYNGLKALAEQNEALIPRLSAACHAYIVDCRAKYPSVELGECIAVDDTTNLGNKDLEFLGININKEFMPTSATTEGLNKQKYKVLTKGRFVFSGMQTGRDVAIRVGLYSDGDDALISPAYTTFSIAKDKHDKLLPEYLFLQFKRSESDRLGWFYSDGSIRSNLDWPRFCEFQIPLPPIEVQQAIVDVYHCMERAKQIAAIAREKLKMLCPALIQRAAHS